MSAVATPPVSASAARALLSEFEQQAPITRRFIERLPEDKLTWKPHDKSMTAGQLAYHLASVPGGVIRLVQPNPAEVQGLPTFPQPASIQECLKTLDESIETVRQILASFDDAAMAESWRLIVAGKEALTMPRQQFIRDVMLSHWYQHRGQFSVYLRLLSIPVPATWGPSADEPPLFLQK
ncbi:DinB family protein [Occallatibacter savannae]|uniref:DinB family protein n=1 Tax=Occallatibacter savannae TaxID=1002691 RepID=UPI000D69EC78|nr:DinB family protein [Occallatibacter savannae]